MLPLSKKAETADNGRQDGDSQRSVGEMWMIGQAVDAAMPAHIVRPHHRGSSGQAGGETQLLALRSRQDGNAAGAADAPSNVIPFADRFRNVALDHTEIQRINEVARRWNSAFGRDLDARLRAAGVDTAQLIPLNIEANGAITTELDTPDKQIVERIFAEDVLLAQQFRAMSADMGRVAELRVSYRYRQDWGSADDTERKTLWRRYSSLSNLLNLLSGQAMLADCRVHWSAYQLALSGAN